jgi:hypothetical protein
MNTNDAIILNIERSAPQSTERVFSVVNPSGESGRKLRVAAYCRVSSDSDDQMNSYLSQMRYYTQVITENPDWELVDIYAEA